jgi:hypothetical protein
LCSSSLFFYKYCFSIFPGSGWRLDYFLLSEHIASRLTKVRHHYLVSMSCLFIFIFPSCQCIPIVTRIRVLLLPLTPCDKSQVEVLREPADVAKRGSDHCPLVLYLRRDLADTAAAGAAAAAASDP